MEYKVDYLVKFKTKSYDFFELLPFENLKFDNFANAISKNIYNRKT